MNDHTNIPSIKDGSDETFMIDVIEASNDLPIIVDFWAPWCGPCKTLGPALEAAIKEQKNKVRLVKIDIDKNPNIAGQLRVQSIPAVFAFAKGQPVDGFMGAQTPAQIQAFIRKTIDAHSPEDDNLLTAVKNANDLLEKGNFVESIEVFKAIIEQDINLTEAHLGLIKSLLGNKELEAAKAAYQKIPDSLKGHADLKTAFAQIQLNEQTLNVGKLTEVKEKSLRSPKNLTLKFDLALALISEEHTEEAINTLLEIIKTKIDWNDGKAKVQLIELLDALGPENQLGRKGRRSLSSILFS